MSTQHIPVKDDDKLPLLLTYNVSSVPDPLPTSTSNGPVTGVVIIKLEPNPDVNCGNITIKVPEGQADTDIFFKVPLPQLTISNNDWSAGSLVHIHDASDGSDYRVWSLTNNVEGQVNETTFTVSGTVNAVDGKACLVIEELSTLIDDNDLQLRQGSFPVVKSGVPPFFLRGLFAIDPLSPGEPCGAFQKGYAVEIAWESNGVSYELYESGITQPVYSGSAKSYRLNNGIANTTTFFCIATDDKGNKLFEPLTLTVINPVLTPQGVVTNGSETVHGEMNVVGNATCNTLRLDNGAAITPKANIYNAGVFNLSGNFSVDTFAFFQNLNASNVNLRHDLHISANVQLPAALSLQQPEITNLVSNILQVDNLTVQGALNATESQVSAFSSFEVVATGITIPVTGRMANTDGMAVLTVNPSPPFTRQTALAYGGLQVNGEWLYATGGTFVSSNLYWHPGFLCLPVPAGTTWYYRGENLNNPVAPLDIRVFWFPAGRVSSRENDGADIPITDNRPDDNTPAKFLRQYMDEKKQQRNELLTSMEIILETKFDDAIRNAMIEQLMAL